MTKKDYELLAQWVKDYTYVDDNGKRIFYSGALEALAIRLYKANPRFDQVRFLLACGEAVQIDTAND